MVLITLVSSHNYSKGAPLAALTWTCTMTDFIQGLWVLISLESLTLFRG